MATLYLDRKGAALDVEAGSLAVRLGGRVATRIPLAPLERVVVHGDATLSTRALAALWRHNVGLLVLSGRHSEATARLVGRPHDDALLRLAQYRRALDGEVCRAAAQAIVAAKLAAEARLLARARVVRPDRRKPLGDALATLERLRARLADPGERLDLGGLVGLEGAGAAAYFRAYASLFPAALGFVRRRRRPPPDPVNACLSLGYTLLHHEAVREAQVIGLDPLIGFLHVPERGRESLACDLVEPLRPHVEEWVWRAFAERRLRGEHFTREKGGACLLGKAGREIFYDGCEPLMAALRRLLRRMARALAAELRKSDPRPIGGPAPRAREGAGLPIPAAPDTDPCRGIETAS
ncbi:MAG TPA: CRISPR-associated endonuclease Cas1 [Stellaceae bacterium]|nr:CRISPR-associated endonuclease Cas1 [Stellaceae bacterium]